MKTHIMNKDLSMEVLRDGLTPQDVLANKVNSGGRDDKDDAFFVCDLGDIVNKYKKWVSCLPRVVPFYAVKCNDSPHVLQVLANLGTGFDCASKTEVQAVLNLGVSPDRIVYANPCKQTSHIRYAKKNGVDLMTFDNEDELHKIKNYFPDASLLLRILPPAAEAQCQLGMKFGCHPSQAPKLLEVAAQLDLNVVGVSFHVGSGCLEASAFARGVESAKRIFNIADQYGFEFNTLDIGGGFPGQESAAISFDEIVADLGPALDEHFPPGSGVRIIAEPGRYFVASAFTVAVNIVAKRMVARDIQEFKDEEAEDAVMNSVAPSMCEEPAFMYYVNDGVYGSFNCLLYDHAAVTPSLMRSVDKEEALFSTSVWGPTCDGLDRIMEHCLLPELHVGDWILFEDMGAYTMAAASTFNGFSKPSCYYVVDANMWGSNNHAFVQSSVCSGLRQVKDNTITMPAMKRGMCAQERLGITQIPSVTVPEV
ncbi:PREDICTED: ornithine decarboxylase-like [Branchiostoma belcheri]|uniref:ornithine decarboxylase n=1 Tax=Branchiostoma belcheri TaxID=7741 RepID=A0A6P4ZCC1_BRABE|nr:PREDICTED: ornithine decarboxylase-like [Branchiostoma belcheri]